MAKCMQIIDLSILTAKYLQLISQFVPINKVTEVTCMILSAKYTNQAFRKNFSTLKPADLQWFTQSVLLKAIKLSKIGLAKEKRNPYFCHISHEQRRGSHTRGNHEGIGSIAHIGPGSEDAGPSTANPKGLAQAQMWAEVRPG